MIINLTIPHDAECLLKVGQAVDFNSAFILWKKLTDTIIPVSKKLRVPNDKIFKYLKKFVGDTISQGQVLAEKKGLIKTISVTSGHSGIIKEINHNDGSVIISTLQTEEKTINAYFKGQTIEITQNQAKIEIGEAKVFILKQIKGDFGGPILYFKNQVKLLFAPEAANKILLTESVSPYLESKAEALGIKGFITLSSLEEKTSLPTAQLKNIDDVQKILQFNFPYCLAIKQYSKIYFYR